MKSLSTVVVLAAAALCSSVNALTVSNPHAHSRIDNSAIKHRRSNDVTSVTCSFWKFSNPSTTASCRWVKNRNCNLLNNGTAGKGSGFCNPKTCCAKSPTGGTTKDVFKYTCARFLDETKGKCAGQVVSDARDILMDRACSWGTTEFVSNSLPVCSNDFCCSWVVIPNYITGESGQSSVPSPNHQPTPNTPNPVDSSVKKVPSVAILEQNYLLTPWRVLDKVGTVAPQTIGGTRKV
eukprot:comp104147_c0_seq1/m.48747 comp104147_c0_seq1/g.48747  ORF comp104147_c0_seq1/g.48747 comp104147_c0_seq1/m.48747 type:complete len:236 (-) comp104147_c0_seq1:43-750(-)